MLLWTWWVENAQKHGQHTIFYRNVSVIMSCCRFALIIAVFAFTVLLMQFKKYSMWCIYTLHELAAVHSYTAL